MSYRQIGTCKFILFGKPESAHARVEVVAEIEDPAIPSLGILVSQSWLLMLESQIGKVSKTVQGLTLETLRDQTLAYFQYGAVPPQREKTADVRHLATLEINLCLGRRLFVLAHPRDFDPHLQADGLAGLVMVNSLPAICAVLEGKLRDNTLYALMYGLHRWETEGRPGVMTTFTQTWDFHSIPMIVERGKELVQRGWATKPHSRSEVDIQSANGSFVNDIPQDHRSTYKDADKFRPLLLGYTDRSLAEGKTSQDVVEDLVQMGFSPEAAEATVAQANDAKKALIYAARSLAEGKTPQSVAEDLVQKGFSPKAAEATVAQANDAKKAAFRQAGCQTFAVGIGLAILGLIITGISYLLAAPEGTYIITTGLFLVGAVNIVRGIVKMVTG